MGPRRTTGGSLAPLPAMLPLGLCGPRLLLAGRQPLPGLHPLEQGGFAVAYGPADRDVGGAVTAHARFGQPGQADLQQLGRFLGREKDDDRHGRPLRRRAAGERRLRGHFPSSREIARNDSDLRVRSALVAFEMDATRIGRICPGKADKRLRNSQTNQITMRLMTLGPSLPLIIANLSRGDLRRVTDGSKSSMTVALKATFYAPAAHNLVVRAGVEKKIIGKTSV
jgi:hypothetical protein